MTKYIHPGTDKRSREVCDDDSNDPMARSTPRLKRSVNDLIKEQGDFDLIRSLRQDEVSDQYESLTVREALARILERLPPKAP